MVAAYVVEVARVLLHQRVISLPVASRVMVSDSVISEDWTSLRCLPIDRKERLNAAVVSSSDLYRPSSASRRFRACSSRSNNEIRSCICFAVIVLWKKLFGVIPRARSNSYRKESKRTPLTCSIRKFWCFLLTCAIRLFSPPPIIHLPFPQLRHAFLTVGQSSCPIPPYRRLPSPEMRQSLQGLSLEVISFLD